MLKTQKPITGVVGWVGFYPSAGQLWIDVGGGEHPTSIVVSVGDPESKITVCGKPATLPEVVAFLSQTSQPQVKAYQDMHHYGACLEADFSA